MKRQTGERITITMPEYAEEEAEEVSDDLSLPSLFPSKLLDSCLAKVQQMVLTTGLRVEQRAGQELERLKR